MVDNNKFNYFDEAIVERRRVHYKVYLVEEETIIYRKVSTVDSIVERTSQEKHLIAILLAYIEYARRTNSMIGGRWPAQLDDKVIVEVTEILLESFLIEELIYKVKSSNWYELLNVFKSNNPIEEMMRL